MNRHQREQAQRFGVEVVEMRSLAAYAKLKAAGPVYITFDMDVLDPAFAPGTGTPEVGGPSSHRAIEYVRSLTGIDFRGFDCVEVAPPYDPTATTALVAATACFEMLSLLAMYRRDTVTA